MSLNVKLYNHRAEKELILSRLFAKVAADIYYSNSNPTIAELDEKIKVCKDDNELFALLAEKLMIKELLENPEYNLKQNY
jgi:hypothetical protein